MNGLKPTLFSASRLRTADFAASMPAFGLELLVLMSLPTSLGWSHGSDKVTVS